MKVDFHKIEKLRTDQGKTIERLIRDADIARNTYVRIRNTRKASFAVLEAIGAALGVSGYELLIKN